MSEENTATFVRLLRLIIPAMVMGVVCFAAIVIFLITGGTLETRPQLAGVLLATLVAFAALEFVAYVVIRKVVTAKLRQKQFARASEAPPEATQAFFVITLIGAAMAEGLSLFGLVILLLTGNWLAIAAPVIGLLLLALSFPSHDKLSRFAASVTGQHWS